MFSKVLAVATLVVGLATATGSHVTPESVALFNGEQLGWAASADQGPLISRATTDFVKSLCGARKTPADQRLPGRVFTAEELAAVVPTAFDSATNWPQCPTITHIRDQSACGSCWAFGAAEAMSDRYCTFGGPKNLLISAATIMECCTYCGNGCSGGQPSSAWEYWTKYGLYDNACQPYPFPTCDHYPTGLCPQKPYTAPACSPHTCTGTGPNATTTIYYGNQSWSVLGVEQYQREIMTNGPIEVAFDVYSDFVQYKSGVYTKSASAKYLGGHAVKMVGWGVLDGVPYWKVANSWNKGWGMDGFFLIRRGADECGIETSGVAGSPRLPAA